MTVQVFTAWMHITASYHATNSVKAVFEKPLIFGLISVVGTWLHLLSVSAGEVSVTWQLHCGM